MLTATIILILLIALVATDHGNHDSSRLSD
jgi:hypothetical protein